jgi:hypothetical protein
MSEIDERPQLETGTTSALDRMALTRRLIDQLLPILEGSGFIIHEFGQHVILQQNRAILARLKKLNSKKSPPTLMVKFSPDYLCAHTNKPGLIFLMDAKTSITPVFFQSWIDEVGRTSGFPQLSREDVGAVEREAWDVYNKFYPPDRVAICFATPYNPRLLVAEWVNKIQLLYRLKEDRNLEAGGSGTPHVNIHLGRMRTLIDFVRQEFEIELDGTSYNDLLSFIKTWPLNKPKIPPPGGVNWTQFNNAVKSLQKTCPWLKERWPEGHPRAPKAPNISKQP